MSNTSYRNMLNAQYQKRDRKIRELHKEKNLTVTQLSIRYVISESDILRILAESDS